MTEQPGPASNRASTLRRPQGRHPSRFQPAIDLSMAKLTPKQVRQWERNNEGRLHSGRCWYMTIVTLRIISLVFTISLAVIGISLVNLYFYDRQNYTMVPSIISGVVIGLWDTSEFIVICARRGRGMPRKVHLYADALIVLLALVSAGMLSYPLLYTIYRNPGYYAMLALSLLLVIIHFIFFCFLRCSRRFRKSRKQMTPRIMYLPTGEPVVVVARPYPPKPTAPPPVELSRLPSIEDDTSPPTPTQPPAAAQVETPVRSPAVTEHRRMSGLHEPSESFRQGMPPRKPVGGSKGTHYAIPWPGPDYEPDEAERARAARGESQAQWMTLAGSTIDIEMTAGR